MQQTPRSSRLHIAIVGRRNAGKSSLINALAGQDIALISQVPGTTTDPVYKAMELLPVGPVVLIDTAGIDDTGDLGTRRVERTRRVFAKTDLVVLVVNAEQKVSSFDLDLLQQARDRKLPVIVAVNKIDAVSEKRLDQAVSEAGEEIARAFGPDAVEHIVSTSAREKIGIEELKDAIVKAAPREFQPQTIVGDLIDRDDTVVLVTPIDEEAPQGRLILPQVQVLRDILDHDAHAVVVQDEGLKAALGRLKERPKLVITDSQAFKKVAEIVPETVPLTSFSILFARFKGDLAKLVEGTKAVAGLRPGSRILVAEACTHRPVGEDIGRVQIPRLLQNFVGGELNFEWFPGSAFPDDVSRFEMAIHCGGCMINRREMLHRLKILEEMGLPVVNYGVLIAYLNGILPRALAPLGYDFSVSAAFGQAAKG